MNLRNLVAKYLWTTLQIGWTV